MSDDSSDSDTQVVVAKTKRSASSSKKGKKTQAQDLAIKPASGQPQLDASSWPLLLKVPLYVQKLVES